VDASESDVRLVEAGAGRRCVVEVSCSKADNPLYRAFRALRALDVQIIHAEVQAFSDRVVQRLHLAESDGGALDPRRLGEALAALGMARPLAFAQLGQAQPLCA
jgi:hypothetical protein